jgi:hypothetical protein
MHLLVLGALNTPVDQTESPVPVTESAETAHLESGPLSTSAELDGLPSPVDRAALDRAGAQRFLGKSAGLSIALRRQGGDQAVWAAALDCLGYSRNRRAFRRVAARLPWSLLSEGLAACADALPMLMWAGGFGPKPRYLRNPGPAGHKPGEPAAGHKPGGPVPDWVLGGRPDNSPERRLVAAAGLAERWSVDGPLKSIIELVRTVDDPKELIRAFVVGAEGHPARGTRALIGDGRAREIVVNAVLTLAHGWSLMADRWDVTEKALQLYDDHPKLPSNAVTREMVSVLKSQGSDIKVRGAKEQQGLLLMYRAMTAGPLYASPPENSETQHV